MPCHMITAHDYRTYESFIMKVLLVSVIFTLVPFLAGCGSSGNSGNSGNNATFGGALYNDSDNDGIIDVIDVDDNNDGLIEISDADQLNNIRYDLFGTSYKISNSDAGNAEGCGEDGCNGYQLINDIDLNPNGSGVKNWEPVGTQSDPFSAIFDGGNYTIRNLIISSSNESVGFLGAMGYVGVGVVKNVHFRGGRVTTTISSRFTGSAVGAIGLTGIVENVSSDLDVLATGGFVGGLVGASGGRIRSGYFIGDVTESGYGVVGGLSASNIGIVRGSYSTGTVTGGVGSGTLGGLVGSNIGIITNCYSASDLIGRADEGSLGGVVGKDHGGYIGKSYFSGTITGKAGNSVVEYMGLFTGFRVIRGRARYGASFYGSYYRYGTGTITGLDDGDVEYSIDSGGVLAVLEPDLLYLTAASTEIDFPGSGWSERNWDFSKGKYPSLKLYSVDKDGNRIEGSILCGQPDTHTQC